MRCPSLSALLLGLAVALAPVVAAAEVLRFNQSDGSYEPLLFAPGAPRPGITLEIVAEIARLTGDDYQTVRVPRKRGREMLARGELDIEVGVDPSWYPRQTDSGHVFTDPIVVAPEILIFTPERPVAYGGVVADLAGRRVATVLGYTYPIDGIAVRDDGPNEQSVILRVSRDRIEIGVVNELVGRWISARDGLPVRFGPAISSGYLCLRFPDDLMPAYLRANQAIRTLKRDGVIARIVASYVKYP